MTVISFQVETIESTAMPSLSNQVKRYWILYGFSPVRPLHICEKKPTRTLTAVIWTRSRPSGVVAVLIPVSCRRSARKPSVTNRLSLTTFGVMVLSAFSTRFTVFWHPVPASSKPPDNRDNHNFFISDSFLFY